MIHHYLHSTGDFLDIQNYCSTFFPFSLEGSGLYIDSYGFKHEKNNENDRLQYICVKLAHFYDSKARSTDECLWRSLLKTYQNNPTIPVSDSSERHSSRD